MTVTDVLRAAIKRMGFLSQEEITILAQDKSSRLDLLLVRCHQGRFLAPAQDVRGLIEAVEAGGWSVRDVSLPPEHSAWRRHGLAVQR
jgi:hypothetical protein